MGDRIETPKILLEIKSVISLLLRKNSVYPSSHAGRAGKKIENNCQVF